MSDRVVALIDMDCFYCQVESRQDPALRGKPAAVVQYNAWKGGGIIAVNYEARAFGVKRNMRGDEAKEKCPDIALVSVPEVREKADLTKYRDAGKEVIQVLLQFKGAVVERASVDEAYLDITRMVQERMEAEGGGVAIHSDKIPNTHIVGVAEQKDSSHGDWLDVIYEGKRTDDIRLAVGAAIVERMRAAVFKQTEFRCSAGIAHNKTLAKLACGINKPNKQTILPHGSVEGLFRTLKVTKLRGLGGKLGTAVEEELGCQTVWDLSQLSLNRVRERFEEKTASWLFHISRGVEGEPVKERDLPKSIGCSKNFPGAKSLDTREKVHHWFTQLAEEVCERLEKDRESNGRSARGMTVSVRSDKGSSSKAGPLTCGYDPEKMARQALALVGGLNESTADPALWRPRVTNLSISAGKFVEESGKTQKIQNFFSKGASAAASAAAARKEKSQEEEEEEKEEDVDVEELVPSLEAFDEAILQLLPVRVKRKALERLEMLRRGAAEAEPTSAKASKGQSGCVGQEEEPSPGPSSAAREEVECDKCGKLVSPFDLPEHLDFHVAKELQAEMSRQERAEAAARARRPTTAAAAVQAPKATTTTKRKKANMHQVDLKCKKQRDITSFLKKL